jgi:hypothetical protein
MDEKVDFRIRDYILVAIAERILSSTRSAELPDQGHELTQSISEESPLPPPTFVMS